MTDCQGNIYVKYHAWYPRKSSTRPGPLSMHNLVPLDYAHGQTIQITYGLSVACSFDERTHQLNQTNNHLFHGNHNLWNQEMEETRVENEHSQGLSNFYSVNFSCCRYELIFDFSSLDIMLSAYYRFPLIVPCKEGEKGGKQRTRAL